MGKKVIQELSDDKKIITQPFEDEMKKSYIDYAMSVIAQRALPDVRDGLKPVQRRVLYDMDLLSMDHNKPHRKSAKVVGDTLGRFHPHGDSSAYGALVHMTQDWIYNHPFVDKHGNFGSIEGDGAAAMRYCLTGGSFINTGSGLVKLRNIVPNTKENSDNPVSIKVKSANGHQNDSDMLFNSGLHTVYKVILQNGMSIKATANHPILISVSNKKGKWVKVEDLKAGMEAVIDVNPDNAMFGENDDCNKAIDYANKFKKDNKYIVVPPYIMQGTRNCQLVYVKTLFSKRGKKLITRSEKFAHQLQILMATQLGFLTVCKYDSKSELWIVTLVDQSKYKKYTTSPVKYVARLEKKEIVYSVRVKSKCHSFTGNGFINHNTEARLSKFSQDLLLSDVNEKVVPFVPNFDDTEKEPTILPAKIPNLLISGSEGIAVGMACSIPTHNLAEVIDGVKMLLTNPKSTLDDLLSVIHGPDFATGGIISNKKDLKSIYETGKGKIRVRGKASIEEKNGKPFIEITEIPATMVGSIDKFIATIGMLIREKKAPDIIGVTNLSDKDGIHLEIDLKKGANPQKTLNLLYKKAKLEDTFSFNMLGVLDGQPMVLSLMEYLKIFIDFQMDIYRKKYAALIKKKQEEKEIKEGLLQAINMIDLIVEIMKQSKSRSQAKEFLMGNAIFEWRRKKHSLHFTESQADAILNMSLSSLIGMEQETILKELEACKKKIDEYSGYLNSSVKLKNRIKADQEEIKKEYAVPRKTIITDEEDVVIEETEEEIMYYFTIDRFRYIKLMDDATYQRNVESISSDYKMCMPIKNTDKVMLFTDTGKMYQIKASNIPLCKYREKGSPIENLSNLAYSENILFVDTANNMAEKKFLFASSHGYVKIVPCNEFLSTSTKAISTTKLPENEILVCIKDITNPLEGEEQPSEIIMQTHNGMYIRFKLSEISEMKKNSNGVRGIKLKEGDFVTACFIGGKNSVFPAFDKTFPFERIRLSKRDCLGVCARLQ